MKQIAKRILSIALDIALVCSVLLFGYICYQRIQSDTPPIIFGWSFAHVVSGSMEPTVPVGSLIAVQEQEEYQVGDIVMYRHENGLIVTHRIVALDGDTIITKGDANNATDPPFHQDQLIGKIQWFAPGIGKAIQIITSSAALPFVLAATAILAFLPSVISKKGKENIAL